MKWHFAPAMLTPIPTGEPLSPCVNPPSTLRREIGRNSLRPRDIPLTRHDKKPVTCSGCTGLCVGRTKNRIRAKLYLLKGPVHGLKQSACAVRMPMTALEHCVPGSSLRRRPRQLFVYVDRYAYAAECGVQHQTIH